MISSSATSTSTGCARTVTQMDNMLFSNMTLNPQPLHIDRHFCETGNRMGPAADELAVHARADDRHFGQRPHGRHHDRQSRHGRGEISRTRCSRATPCIAPPRSSASGNSKSRPDAGIVQFHHRAYNQDDKLVADCRRQAFMRTAAALMRSLLFVPANGGSKLEKALGARRRRGDRRSRRLDRSRRQGRGARQRRRVPHRRP